MKKDLEYREPVLNKLKIKSKPTKEEIEKRKQPLMAQNCNELRESEYILME